MNEIQNLVNGQSLKAVKWKNNLCGITQLILT